MIHPTQLSDEKLLQQCKVTRTKRGGPGGQHRNKVESAVVILHNPSGCSGEASERRNQHENRRLAIRRLRVNLALHVRTQWSNPSSLWKKRCKNRKIAINPEHADFPLLLSEVLDAWESSHKDLKHAQEKLDCSISQLIKFLKIEPRALQIVNQHRTENGDHEFK